MHVRSARLVLVATAVAATTLSLAGPALADDGDRGRGKPGFSIQEAVDKARPGDTIHIPSGTYDESVVISTDGITLRGRNVVIEPRTADPTPCDEAPRVSGICITDEVLFPTDPEGEVEVVDAVRNVTIRGITVTGATGDGLVGLGTENLDVRDSAFKDNGGYGAASFVGKGTTFENNTAKGNHEAGFYVGDSPDSGAEVKGNYSADNELGFFFRSASDGEARRNVAEGNCFGVLVLADAPGPAADWEIRDNKVRNNSKVCADPSGSGGFLSGAGILLLGATDFEVRDNTVTGNVSKSEGPSLAEGGIVVRTGFGGTAPTGTIGDNRVRDNAPADLVWDESGDVEFDDNRCRTSLPDGLCD
ncbi:right-handed parallel beta-helix repeat-containing protein [Geodermatophilus ruber]|uniref:Right handed beta helix region n=1 Tax=Geodermatophilus ruber TaxID=504800 RepID=A0A1I3YWS4_9ACTN|nr:right-handed parallel beta-helix repeat-containing protein [Geodermatophilus ruber]SFK35819.1 Right handed beta helix region [Geodermatophilus ruber]